MALRSPDLTEFNDIARHIDAYAETGCTLQLFDANGARTRPLLGLAGTATIQATFDPRT